eukprot:jgi/Chrpa1/11353/Chrysochromulina_OHIO_Genome00019578-RA
MSCTREATSAKRRLNEMPLRGSTMTVVFDSARNEPSTQSQQPQSSAPPAPPTPKPPLPTPAMQPPVMPRPAPAPGGPGGFTGAMPMNGFVNGFPGSKLPPFFLPERMERDVHENRVLKMRSVLWTAKEEDIRNFYKPLVLDRDAIEMGKDHAGRFSGMVYRALSEALAAAPAADALAAVRTFLSTDPRLPPNTRRAMTLLHELRTKLLDDPSCTASVLTRHAFRSPFESAGVLGYTLPEIEACFGTRSADSVFWPMFQTFHTILPHQADDDVEDDSLADFLAA